MGGWVADVWGACGWVGGTRSLRCCWCRKKVDVSGTYLGFQPPETPADCRARRSDKYKCMGLLVSGTTKRRTHPRTTTRQDRALRTRPVPDPWRPSPTLAPRGRDCRHVRGARPKTVTRRQKVSDAQPPRQGPPNRHESRTARWHQESPQTNSHGRHMTCLRSMQDARTNGAVGREDYAPETHAKQPRDTLTMHDIDIWAELESHDTNQLRAYDDIEAGSTVLLCFSKPHAHGSRAVRAEVTDTTDIGREVSLASGETRLRLYMDRASPVIEVTADESGDFGGSIGRVTEAYVVATDE